MIKLETERLVIRDHVEEDLAGLNRLLQHEEAMYYLPDVKTSSLAESKANLEIAISEAASPNRLKYFFAITERDSSNYVGEIGFTVFTEKMGGRVVNLGYFILPGFWRKGYVTEAARRVIDFAFSSCGVHKITTGCLKENTASEKVMIKCGMKKEADFKRHVWHDGEWKDRVEYALLREEWQRMKDPAQRG